MSDVPWADTSAFGGGGGFRFLLGKLCFVNVLYGSTPAGGAGAGLRGRFNL